MLEAKLEELNAYGHSESEVNFQGVNQTKIENLAKEGWRLVTTISPQPEPQIIIGVFYRKADAPEAKVDAPAAPRKQPGRPRKPMPRYPYYCDTCGKKFEVERRMDDRREEEECIYCGCMGERAYPPDSAPYVINDIQPYHDRGMGIDIHSRSEKKAFMKAKGLVEGSDSFTKEAEEIVKEQYARSNKRPPKINK